MQFPCNSLSLCIAARRVTEIYDRMFAPLGIASFDFHLLAVVSSIGPVSKNALCRTLILDGETLNRSIRPLVDAGWLTVSSSGKAGLRIVAITESGLAMKEQGERRLAAAQAVFDKAIGKRASDEMRDLLHEVINAPYAVTEGL